LGVTKSYNLEFASLELGFIEALNSKLENYKLLHQVTPKLLIEQFFILSVAKCEHVSNPNKFPFQIPR